MAAVSQLGYLGLGVKDVDAWRGYAETVLGLRAVEGCGNGDLLLGMDDHHHRFTLHEDARDDVAYIGWQAEGAGATGFVEVFHVVLAAGFEVQQHRGLPPHAVQRRWCASCRAPRKN